jgi:hypothetical protein
MSRWIEQLETEIQLRLTPGVDQREIERSISEVEQITETEKRDEIFSHVAERLFALNLLDYAEMTIQHISNPVERFDLQIKVLPNKLRTTDEAHYLQKIEDTARAIELSWQRAHALNELARILSQTNLRNKADDLWAEAVEIANAGQSNGDKQDRIDCVSSLSIIAVDLAKDGRFQIARQAATRIQNEYKRVTTMRIIDSMTSE